MPARTFTVFRDAPSAKPPSLRPLGRSLSASAVLTTSRRAENSAVSLPEKENLHPLTGLGDAPVPSGKKRKASESGSVLAPKVFGGSESSAMTKPKAKRTDLKRKATSLSASGRNKVKKEHSKKVEASTVSPDVESAPSRKSKPPPRESSRTSSVVLLETITEEATTQVSESGRLNSEPDPLVQALIDSRCYELTVSPLADISDAYLQSSESKLEDEPKAKDLTKNCSVEVESGFETLIRDYFLSEPSVQYSRSSIASSSSATGSLFTIADELDVQSTSDFRFFGPDNSAESTPPITPKKPGRLLRSVSLPGLPITNTTEKDDVLLTSEPVILSTPERKELYATFTFTTPKSSPAQIL